MAHKVAPACNVVSVAPLPITCKFLFPNLKSTFQVHRHSRCEICFISEEAPAQKYHQLCSSFHQMTSLFCNAWQSSLCGHCVLVCVWLCTRPPVFVLNFALMSCVFVNVLSCVSKCISASLQVRTNPIMFSSPL